MIIVFSHFHFVLTNYPVVGTSVLSVLQGRIHDFYVRGVVQHISTMGKRLCWGNIWEWEGCAPLPPGSASVLVN